MKKDEKESQPRLLTNWLFINGPKSDKPVSLGILHLGCQTDNLAHWISFTDADPAMKGQGGNFCKYAGERLC